MQYTKLKNYHFNNFNISSLVQLKQINLSLLFLVSAIGVAIFLASHPICGILYEQITTSILRLSINQHTYTMPCSTIVNELLLTIFYYTVGLDLKNKLLKHDFTYKNLKVVAATTIGGYIVALITYLFMIRNHALNINYCSLAIVTDTTLILNLLNIFHKKLSSQAILFVSMLAIVDDITETILIMFYNLHTINYSYLILSMIIISLLLLYRKINIISITLNFILLYLLHKTGFHSVTNGLCIAMLTPTTIKQMNISMPALLKYLHNINSLIILPLYVFFNVGININTNFFHDLVINPSFCGIMLAMLLGKPVGIILFGYISNYRLLAINFKELIIAGYFCSIGFTTSLLIASIVLEAQHINNMKIVILLSSIISVLFQSILILLLQPSQNELNLE